MQTYFHIANKDFTDYLKVTVQGAEYYFCDDLTIEYSDRDTLNLDIELIKADDYLKSKAKNSFLRFLLNMFKWIFAPLIYFIDNEDGIGLDKGYLSFDPFTIKQSLSIDCPNEKTINISYFESKYNKMTKKYTPPTLKIQENIVIKTEEIAFSPFILKREWNTYHIPAFTLIMILITLFNLLIFSIFVKIIKELPLYPTSENIGKIIGISFCAIIMIALLVVYIIVIVKSYNLYKKILKENSELTKEILP